MPSNDSSLTRLTEVHYDSDQEEETAEREYESTWVSSTVLKVSDIVDKATIASIDKYFAKHPRIWQDSSLVDEEEDDEDDDEED